MAAEVDNTRAVVVTTAVSAAVVVAAHGLLGLNHWLGTNDDLDDDLGLAWQPIVGVALSTVAIVSFGGFYVASRRARVAIGSSFVLTFLAMLPFALTIPALAPNAETAFAKALVDQFSATVGTVVAFYFGSEAVISGLKLWTISRNPEAAPEIKRADRDLATHPAAPEPPEPDAAGD
ncbi:hypothetical protein [Cellulomonas persica]|uniref:Uncharacterized protein n=1 Tax=Cellulomonas persica TaxID=76861 RepID=A0A510UWL7_9CELL|nr:hypothetical protein [Cellulomonas persica]GEK18906.1 hypothetical protein CPE01_26390 [Cellulomonas persica]